MTGTKAVIADDSPLMRAMMTKILQENNIEVLAEATNGEEAVKLFEMHKPHLMTLDIEMPKKMGTEVLEELIEKYPDANIIMVSSLSDARVIMKCLKTGAKRYIVKPFDDKAVMDAIRKVIKGS
ncbi:MAG TPA: response regulator [Nitrospinota bacterium]|jgi:two-component system chemotaxis response regulator CheY|nr:response regulator [Nitrospinota bacterium]